MGGFSNANSHPDSLRIVGCVQCEQAFVASSDQSRCPQAWQSERFLEVNSDPTKCQARTHLSTLPVDNRDRQRFRPVERRGKCKRKSGNSTRTHAHTQRQTDREPHTPCNARLTGAAGHEAAVNTNFTSITTRTRRYHRQRPSSTRDSATAALVAIATALQSIEACVGAVGGEPECPETITSQTLKTRCHEGASAQSTPTPSFALEAHREGFRGLHLAL